MDASAASGTYAVSVTDVLAARGRIAPWARRTPILSSASLDALAGRSLHFKAEPFQRTGSFKFRGAANAVRWLDDASAARGVATHSSGNHAQALALAARLRGIAAHIVMPSNAPAVKRAAVEAYGGIVTLCEPNLAAREAGLADIVARTGAVAIPPFDHPMVIAGQGTIACEILEDVPDVDTIVAPVGGGGMIGGIAIATRALSPRTRVIAAEPAGAADAALSKRTGVRQPMANPQTIADGLRTSLGELTFPIVRDLVDEVIVVQEREIIAAMRLVWERLKVVIEPSAAVGVAAMLRDDVRCRSELGVAAVVLCGGNVDAGSLA
ncbi:MAG: pyridoxal-phosphate dependent enzyme [Phycisphaerales bacterium]|nr:pyridoxal-phosphate dependent enzyme [Phycisphaerales bacterium]